MKEGVSIVTLLGAMSEALSVPEHLGTEIASPRLDNSKCHVIVEQ